MRDCYWGILPHMAPGRRMIIDDKDDFNSARLGICNDSIERRQIERPEGAIANAELATVVGQATGGAVYKESDNIRSISSCRLIAR